MDVGWLCQRHKGSSRNELLDGIRVHRVGGRFTLYPRVVISYLFRLRGRYDVIVDCENGIPFFTPLFARIPKVLLVHHVHREIFRRETHPPLRWLGYWLEGWLMPRVYQQHTGRRGLREHTGRSRRPRLQVGADSHRPQRRR